MTQKLELPRGVQIIKCKSIEFEGKDIIVLEDWKDFLWLLGNCVSIYKLKKTLYNLGGDVAYVFELNGKEV